MPYFHPECLGWWCLHPGAILPGGAPRGDVEGAGVSAMGWTTLFSWRRGPSSPSPWTGSLYSPVLCSLCLGGPIEFQHYVSFLHWIPEISAHELKKAMRFVGQWFHPGFPLPLHGFQWKRGALLWGTLPPLARSTPLVKPSARRADTHRMKCYN